MFPYEGKTKGSLGATVNSLVISGTDAIKNKNPI
jgi:hypothetical protein